MTQCDIGLIGLAVMGQNLVLNMNDHGYAVAVFNRTATKTQEFLSTTAKENSGCRCLYPRRAGQRFKKTTPDYVDGESWSGCG